MPCERAAALRSGPEDRGAVAKCPGSRSSGPHAPPRPLERRRRDGQPRAFAELFPGRLSYCAARAGSRSLRRAACPPDLPTRRLPMPLLSFDSVSIAFGAEPLLDHASFQIDPGERVCLIGRNGAGKSTLLKLAEGSLAPDSGRDLAAAGAAHRAARAGAARRRVRRPCSTWWPVASTRSARCSRSITMSRTRSAAMRRCCAAWSALQHEIETPRRLEHARTHRPDPRGPPPRSRRAHRRALGRLAAPRRAGARAGR